MKQSLQAMYKYEMEKIETFECEKYYFTFAMVEDQFHVYQIFVHPDFRRSQVTQEMLDLIEKTALEKGAGYIVGFIHLGLPDSERNIMVQLKRGMKIVEVTKGPDGREKMTLIKEVIK